MSDFDTVKREGATVTVRVRDLEGTRTYSDPWCAKRAERKLRESHEARLKFFKPKKVKRTLRLAGGGTP